MDAPTQKNFVHRPDLAGSSAQAVIVGGGPTALHTAHRLHEASGDSTRILVVTQEDAFGGLSQRSLEQFRMAFDRRVQAQLVQSTLDLYRVFEQELGRPMHTPFPYVFALSTPAAREFHRGIIESTRAWGFDSGGALLEHAAFRDRFPFIDGEAVSAVALYENCGRLHFDEMKSALIERSPRATFAAGVRATRVIVEHGKVTGVETSRGRVAAERVIVAPGAFVMRLPELVPDSAFVRELAGRFTVTKRQLFTASIEGAPVQHEVFVVSPDLAIVRFEVRNGVGTYGYARPDQPAVTDPQEDPQPDRGELEFPAIVYDLLSKALSMYGEGPHTLARQPHAWSAGYYTAYADGMPVVGEAPDVRGLFLLAGAHHYGVMAAEGLAACTAGAVLDGAPVPDELSLTRIPIGGDSFVL